MNRLSPRHRSLRSEPVHAAELTRQAEALAFSAPQQALSLCEQIYGGSQAQASPGAVADALLIAGNCYEALSLYADALKKLDAALALYRKSENAAGEAKTLKATGTIYYHLGDYAAALDFYLKSLALFQTLGVGDEQGWVLTYIGVVYLKLDNLTEALKYQRQSIAFLEGSGNRMAQANAFNNLGLVYFQLKNYKDAIEAFTQALAIGKTLDDASGDASGVVSPMGNLALCYQRLGAFPQALSQYQALLKLVCSRSSPSGEAITLSNIGDLYLIEHSQAYSPETALTYLHKALGIAERIEKKPLISSVHASLAQAFERLGNHQQALLHHRRFYEVDKQLFNEETVRRFQAAQARFDIERLQSEKDKLALELTHKNKQLAAKALQIIHHSQLLNTLTTQLSDIMTGLSGDSIASELERRLSDAGSGKNHLPSLTMPRVKAAVTAATQTVLARTPIAEVLQRMTASAHIERDWKAFEAQFNELHHGYITRLSAAFPKLTASELKICALLKVGLTTKDIAKLLRIAVHTVEVHRSNLRNKLRLRSKTRLETFLSAFDQAATA